FEDTNLNIMNELILIMESHYQKMFPAIKLTGFWYELQNGFLCYPQCALYRSQDQFYCSNYFPEKTIEDLLNGNYDEPIKFLETIGNSVDIRHPLFMKRVNNNRYRFPERNFPEFYPIKSDISYDDYAERVK